MIIYQAFIESELEVPSHPAWRVRDLYFSPKNPDFEPRTVWTPYGLKTRLLPYAAYK